MANYSVVWEARTEVEVEAENVDDARKKSRSMLDPDVDWDLFSITALMEGTDND